MELSGSDRPARHGRCALLAPAILASIVLGIAIPAPAFASCVVVDSVEAMVAEADAAFVGVVELVSNMDRWAVVRVDEVWHGPVETAVVEVRGGEGPGVGSSVDRTYQVGTRYLFAVSAEGGTFRDSSCSMTSVWHDDLLTMRPANARAAAPPAPVSTGAVDPATLLLPAALVVAAAVLVFGLVFGIRRRA